MTEDFEAQLKWFTKRLLQIRLIEVRGFSLPIPFELSDIENNDALEFSAEQPPKEHLEDLIEEIRGYYIKHNERPASRDDIRLEYSENNLSVEIFGIDSDLLRSFLIRRLKTHTSLLETGTGNAVLYVGLDTGVVLGAAEQSILARLRSLKEEEKVLSYGDIFEIVVQHKGTERDIFRRSNTDEEKKNGVARSAISYLLDKIKRSERFEHIKRDQIIENVRGTGYQLMM